MNSVKDVLEKYNYRIDKLTLNNNIRILDSPSGKFVVKKRKNKDTRELFRYLNSRGFDNYLDYINHFHLFFELIHQMNNNQLVEQA